MWAAAKHDVSPFLPEQEWNKRSHEQGSPANKRVGGTGLQVKKKNHTLIIRPTAAQEMQPALCERGRRGEKM